jgi:hypothetical protein
MANTQTSVPVFTPGQVLTAAATKRKLILVFQFLQIVRRVTRRLVARVKRRLAEGQFALFRGHRHDTVL